MGEAVMKCSLNDEDTITVYVQDVLYSPDLDSHLLSVNYMIKKDIELDLLIFLFCNKKNGSMSLEQALSECGHFRVDSPESCEFSDKRKSAAFVS